MPIRVMVSKVSPLGKPPISLQLGPGFCADAPEGGPSWRLGFAVTLLFPK